MSDVDRVLVEDRDGVRTLILNRPAQLNAFDQVQCAAFTDGLRSAQADDSIRVNGIAVGIGATLLGHADLVFMADTARLQCPFTSLALAPEAAASVTLPLLVGRQAAYWMLTSSEWIDATEARSMGLAWKIVPDDDVLIEAQDHARRLAVHPLASLVACKRLIAATFADAITDGRRRENVAFDALLPTTDCRAAVRAFATRRRAT